MDLEAPEKEGLASVMGLAVLPVLVTLKVGVSSIHCRVEAAKGVNLPLVIDYSVTTSGLWAGALNRTDLAQK